MTKNSLIFRFYYAINITVKVSREGLSFIIYISIEINTPLCIISTETAPTEEAESRLGPGLATALDIEQID